MRRIYEWICDIWDRMLYPEFDARLPSIDVQREAAYQLWAPKDVQQVEFSQPQNPASFAPAAQEADPMIGDPVCAQKFNFESMAIWLAKQTELVQETARMFPVPLAIPLRLRTVYVVGYSPEGDLACIDVDPQLLTCEQFAYRMLQPMQFRRDFVIKELVRH